MLPNSLDHQSLNRTAEPKLQPLSFTNPKPYVATLKLMMDANDIDHIDAYLTLIPLPDNCLLDLLVKASLDEKYDIANMLINNASYHADMLATFLVHELEQYGDQSVHARFLLSFSSFRTKVLMSAFTMIEANDKLTNRAFIIKILTQYLLLHSLVNASLEKNKDSVDMMINSVDYTPEMLSDFLISELEYHGKQSKHAFYLLGLKAFRNKVLEKAIQKTNGNPLLNNRSYVMETLTTCWLKEQKIIRQQKLALAYSNS